MDKTTINHYAWIIVSCMVIATLVAFATPFGDSLGISFANMVKNQNNELQDAFSEENIAEQERYMNNLFDTVELLQPGLYTNAKNADLILSWDELIEKGYMDYYPSDGALIINSNFPSQPTGDLVVAENVVYVEIADNCTGLKAVYLKDYTQYIGYNAFEACENLETFVGGRNLTEVKAGAFYCCYELKNVYLENGIKRLESESFNECDNLIEIHYNGTIDEWNDIIKEDYWCSPALRRIICNDGIIEI